MNLPINIPNIITCFRLFSPIPVLYLLHTGNVFPSFIVFICAAISDFLDGFIARAFKIQSTAGAILDPTADKVLMISVYTYFMLLGEIHWLTATTVIMRDVLIMSGVAFLKYNNIEIKFSPLYASKVNTAIQLIFIAAIYICMLASIGYSEYILNSMSVLVIASAIYSGYMYYKAFLTYV